MSSPCLAFDGPIWSPVHSIDGFKGFKTLRQLHQHLLQQIVLDHVEPESSQRGVVVCYAIELSHPYSRFDRRTQQSDSNIIIFRTRFFSVV